jgi:hypothetical protein
MALFDSEPETITGDDARVYWLGVIYDELAGEISAATATQELSQARFQYILRKLNGIIRTASQSDGSVITQEIM